MPDPVKSSSPTRATSKAEEPKETVVFGAVINAILTGNKIRRKSWPKDEYGQLRDGLLHIFIRGAWHQWILNDGDFSGEDWEIIAQ